MVEVAGILELDLGSTYSSEDYNHDGENLDKLVNIVKPHLP